LSEFLSPAEIAERLNLNRTTVYALIRRGELPSSKVGKQVRVAQADLDAYIGSKKVGSLPAGAEARQESRPEPPADVNRTSFRRDARDTIIVAGQDPCLELLFAKAASARRRGSPTLLRSYLGSYNGLVAMYTGRTTASAANMWDAETDTYNTPYIKRLLPGVPVGVLRLVGRQQGLFVRAGNPKNIAQWSDLTNPDVTVVTRERGSGTRILLDQKLRQLGIEPSAIAGYEREETSHLAVVGAVAKGAADVGFGCESASRTAVGVDFVPLQLEWYDFVFRLSDAQRPMMRVMLDYAGSDAFREDIAAIGAYDVSQTGKYVEM
jgi:putative molybdopterin biosynthesis protein